MTTKKPPPKRYGSSGPSTSRTSKSNRGQALPMPKKRTPYTSPRSGGNQLGSYGHGHGKGAPTSADLVKKPVRQKRAS